MKRMNKILNYFEEYLAVTSLLFTSLLVFVQALLRYGFNSSLYWSDEVARYTIIWFIFIGSSIAVREKAHATVDAVTAFLPPLFQKIFSVLANIAGIIFCIIVVWSGKETVLSVVEYGSVTPSLGISMAFPYLAIPVGGILMLIRFLQLLINDIKSIISQIEGAASKEARKP